MSTFLQLPAEHGAEWASGSTRVAALSSGTLTLPDDATHFAFVLHGDAELSCASGDFRVGAGMYFAAPGAATLRGSAAGFVVSHVGHRGLFHLGGPIEALGRLRYIDGCTDSLLVPPVICGDPCLNHLHIPARTSQSRHTHPSVRVGMIARGKGRCVLPDAEVALRAGLLFVIEPEGLHSFFTDEESLDVVVYHPDSDTGPTHQDHPMLNRTVLPREVS